jgi:DNA-binding NarL/FixJ family response regulator
MAWMLAAKQNQPGVKLVFPTMTKEPNLAAEAFRRGASAFVLQQSAGDELLLATRKVHHGESYLSPLIAEEMVTYLLVQGIRSVRRNALRKGKASACSYSRRRSR